MRRTSETVLLLDFTFHLLCFALRTVCFNLPIGEGFQLHINERRRHQALNMKECEMFKLIHFKLCKMEKYGNKLGEKKNA